MPANVAAAFEAFPMPVRERLLEIRRLIFQTADRIDSVGPLTETLKWGEPAYLTEASGSGTTIRLGWHRASDQECAVLFNCKTTLIKTFRMQFADLFEYQGNRAILIRSSAPFPETPLVLCLGMALTYHQKQFRRI